MLYTARDGTKPTGHTIGVVEADSPALAAQQIVHALFGHRTQAVRYGGRPNGAGAFRCETKTGPKFFFIEPTK